MYSCASLQKIVMNKLKAKCSLDTHKKRGRRDVLSESLYPCKFCPKKNQARVRDIRTHLVKVHKKWSYFKCNEINSSGIKCNFYCHDNLACFAHHARDVHEEYFNGAQTKLIEEESFELVLTDLDQKEFQHSEVCLEAKSVNRTTKKSFIRKRGLCENKVLEDFMAGTVADDVVMKRKHYRAGLVGVKRLQKDFPRRYNRKLNNTTLGKKEIFYHFDLYEQLKIDLEKNKKK